MVRDRDRLATYKPCQDGLDRIIYLYETQYYLCVYRNFKHLGSCRILSNIIPK